MTVEAPLTDDGQRVRLWHDHDRDADGIERDVPLSTDKTAAQQLLNEWVKCVALARVGIVDPFQDHRMRTLVGHLTDFRDFMMAKGNTPEYARRTCNRVQACLNGCRLRHQFISNLAAAGVHPQVAQLLARHSTITLTMDRYTHLELADRVAALDKLPKLPVPDRNTPQTLAPTGTDGRGSLRLG